MVAARRERCVPTCPNEVWSLDFVADQLANGARLRVLTSVDVFTREAPATKAGQRARAEDVAAVPNRLVAQRRAPKLFSNNGNEFSARLLDMWAYTTTRCRSTSAGWVSRPTTASSELSMHHFGTNA